MEYPNPWVYNDKIFNSEDIDKHYGFVYLLHNKINGKKYIGKKFFWTRKTKQVKGKKKRFLAESDWKEYYGSNKNLLTDIEQHGINAIDRKILRLCFNKTQCAYWELHEQIINGALLKEEYYNEWISVKIRQEGLKVGE